MRTPWAMAGARSTILARIIAARPSQTEFEVFAKEQSLGTVTLGIPGKHNVSNAMAVIALATRLGVSFEAIQRALGSFRGAKRRFDIRHGSERFTIIRRLRSSPHGGESRRWPRPRR